MRVMVLGATGLIGSHVAQCLQDVGHTVTAPPRRRVDIVDSSTVESALRGNIIGDETAIDCLINCAGHTDTIAAERDMTDAVRLNEIAPGNLAKCCYRRNIRFIHLSTELVLPSSDKPLDESAPIKGWGVYGRTKAEGEDMVLRQSAHTATIVRTSSVYGYGGRNWASNVAHILMDGHMVNADTVRRVTPNSAIEVARAVSSLIDDSTTKGVYHVSAPGQTTWAEWCADLARMLGVPADRVVPYEHHYVVPRPNVELTSQWEWMRCRKSIGHALDEYVGVLNMLHGGSEDD